MDIRAYNRAAWDYQVSIGNPWTVPVDSKTIRAVRRGNWHIILTPTKPVPREWFPQNMTDIDILCLASGGGQQGPVLAATGARVTVFDNSPAQLKRDQEVAERENLHIQTVEGDMRDLSDFPNSSFDLIVHPVSNIFVPEILPVWFETYRVLRPGGSLLSGITNPIIYIFDDDDLEDGKLTVSYALPYSDLTSISAEIRQDYMEQGFSLQFSHTLEEQIGGQVKAGFVIAGFYEDIRPDDLLSKYFGTFFATRALKLAAVE
jgi:SAM-dependent methyltransferase